MDSEDFDELIDAEAQKAASMASDAGKVERRSLTELNEIRRSRAADRAGANAGGAFGLRFIQLVPPGAG